MGKLGAAVLGLIAGFTVAVEVGNEVWETRAIKAGVAYYACEADTGKCTFTWKVQS